MGNSSGSYYSKRENTMAAFDKLPPTARAALANAAFDWAPQPIVTQWRRGTKGMKTGQEIAAKVAEWDAKAIARNRARVWGIKDEAPQRNSRKAKR